MNAWTLRMRDLCAESGLTRQAIHYYIQEGLLPPGRKTGRNMAFYGVEHLERLHNIRRLQHERFLPLKAIKALLDERDATIEGFDPPQRVFLRAIRSRIFGEAKAAVSVEELLDRGLIEREDLDKLVEDGAIAIQKDPDTGEARVHPDDVALVDLFGQLRSVGITEEAGFTVEDLAIYEQAVARLIKAETALIVRRMGHRPPDEVAAIIQQSMPIVSALISHLRERRVHDLLAAI